MPGPFTAQCHRYGRGKGGAGLEPFAHFRAGATPLFPVTHADAASKPVVNFRNRPVAVRDPEGVHPTSEILCKLLEPVGHGNKPTAARELLDPTLEFPEGFVGPADADPWEGEAKKGGLTCRCHPALFLVDLELEETLKKALDALHHSISRSPALHQDDEVVGIPGEVVTSAFELPVQSVQSVQDDIGRQRRKWTALGNSDAGIQKLAINQNPGAKVASDEARDTLVANLSGHAVHQDIVIYSIEELGQVQIYSNAAAFSDEFPNPVHRIMDRPSGAKAEARIRKAWIKDRRQLPGYGLLDQSVEDRGNPERADATLSALRTGEG